MLPTHPAISNDLLKALIKVFDLEGKRVTALTLSLRWNEFAKLEIERAPLVEEVQELCDVSLDRGPGWEKSLVVVDKVVSPVDDSGKARPTSSRVYPGAEEIALELAAKEAQPSSPSNLDSSYRICWVDGDGRRSVIGDSCLLEGIQEAFWCLTKSRLPKGVKIEAQRRTESTPWETMAVHMQEGFPLASAVEPAPVPPIMLYVDDRRKSEALPRESGSESWRDRAMKDPTFTEPAV